MGPVSELKKLAYVKRLNQSPVCSRHLKNVCCNFFLQADTPPLERFERFFRRSKISLTLRSGLNACYRQPSSIYLASFRFLLPSTGPRPQKSNSIKPSETGIWRYLSKCKTVLNQQLLLNVQKFQHKVLRYIQRTVVIARCWEQPRCPAINEGVNGLVQP